jgi:hypothetical protein
MSTASTPRSLSTLAQFRNTARRRRKNSASVGAFARHRGSLPHRIIFQYGGWSHTKSNSPSPRNDAASVASNPARTSPLTHATPSSRQTSRQVPPPDIGSRTRRGR